jgi:hypothetical protein
LRKQIQKEQAPCFLTQYNYQVAGSLVQLKLPCASSCEYAARMAA